MGCTSLKSVVQEHRLVGIRAGVVLNELLGLALEHVGVMGGLVEINLFRHDIVAIMEVHVAL